MKKLNSDLTILQAAKILSIHPETMRELARTEQVVGIYKIGGRWRISEDALDVIRRIPDLKEVKKYV